VLLLLATYSSCVAKLNSVLGSCCRERTIVNSKDDPYNTKICPWSRGDIVKGHLNDAYQSIMLTYSLLGILPDGH